MGPGVLGVIPFCTLLNLETYVSKTLPLEVHVRVLSIVLFICFSRPRNELGNEQGAIDPRAWAHPAKQTRARGRLNVSQPHSCGIRNTIAGLHIIFRGLIANIK